MRTATRFVVSAAVLSFGWFSVGSTLAQAPGDPISSTDPFNGAVFDDARSTDYIGPGFGIPNLEAIFDGTNSASIFSDSVTVDDPAVLTFTRSNTTPIFGVNLFTGSDGGETGARSTSDFRLEADNNNDGTFETILVAGGNPIDDGTSNFFAFAGESTATTFQATFTPGNVGGCCNGPRVVELDAVTVPEPAAVTLVALAGLGLLARRRRA